MRCSQAQNAASWPGLTRGAVAAQAASRHRFCVDRVAVGLLVRAAIGGKRAAERRRQCLASMAAIGAGIRNDPDLDRDQRPVTARAELYFGCHRVPRRGADELLLAGELPLDRTPGLQCRQDAEILGQHLLLAAKPAADPLGKDVHVAHAEAEDVAELLPRDERSL